MSWWRHDFPGQDAGIINDDWVIKKIKDITNYLNNYLPDYNMANEYNILNVLYPPAMSNLMPLKNNGEDCTEDYTKMLKYAMTNGYDALFFPDGKYAFDSYIANPINNIAFIGGDNTIFTRGFETINSSHIHDAENTANQFEFSHGITLKNITFSAESKKPSESGIKIYGLNIKLQNIEVKNFGNIGIEIGSPGGLNSAQTGYPLQDIFASVVAHDNDGGNMYYNGQTDSDMYDMRFYNSKDERSLNTSNVIFDYKGAGCRVYGFHIWGLYATGLSNYATDLEMYGAHIEGAATKVKLYSRMILYGQLYDTGENPTCVGISFENQIRNAIIKITTRQLYRVINFNSKNGNLNLIMINANTSVNGAKLFDQDPGNYNFVMAQQYDFSTKQTYTYAIADPDRIITESRNDHYTNSNIFFRTATSILMQILMNPSSNAYPIMISGNNTAGIHSGGTSSNIDLELIPKGTGHVIIGGNYETESVSQKGTLEVKLSNGKIIKLLTT